MPCSVRANTRNNRALWPRLIQLFCPFNRHPRFSLVAVVAMAAISLPDSASVSAKAAKVRPDAKSGSHSAS